MKYPEHEKLSSRKEEHENISEFMEWLEARGFRICEVDKTRPALYYTTYLEKHPVKILSEYFEVDPKKLDAEKQQMLDELQTS